MVESLASIGGILLHLFWAVVALVGLLLFVFATAVVLKWLRIRSWPSVEGRLVAFEKAEPAAEQDMEELNAAYTYQVGARTFTSDKFAWLGGSKSRTNEVLNAGQAVLVHYPPDAPEKGVILAANLKFMFIFFLFAMVFLGGAVVAFISMPA